MAGVCWSGWERQSLKGDEGKAYGSCEGRGEGSVSRIGKEGDVETDEAREK